MVLNQYRKLLLCSDQSEKEQLKTLIYKKFITYFDQVCKLSLEHTCTPRMETNNNVLKSAE